MNSSFPSHPDPAEAIPPTPASFDFSYGFVGGITVAGSFVGLSDGKVVSSLTNIQIAINDVPVPGPIFAACYDFDTGNYEPGSVVGFSAADSNFLFADSNFPTDPNYSHFFYLVSGVKVSVFRSPALGRVMLAEDMIPSSWSLKERYSSVPSQAEVSRLRSIVSLLDLTIHRCCPNPG